MKKRLFFILILMLASSAFGQSVLAQPVQSNTYCNPLDIDYTYMVYNSSRNISYRSGADPAVVEFRGEYYLFVTRSFGYWRSTDLVNWVPVVTSANGEPPTGGGFVSETTDPERPETRLLQGSFPMNVDKRFVRLTVQRP